MYNQQCRQPPVCNHQTWPVCVCVCNCLMKKTCVRSINPISPCQCAWVCREGKRFGYSESRMPVCGWTPVCFCLSFACFCVLFFKYCMISKLHMEIAYCLGKRGLSILCHILKEWPPCFVYYVKYSTIVF